MYAVFLLYWENTHDTKSYVCTHIHKKSNFTLVTEGTVDMTAAQAKTAHAVHRQSQSKQFYLMNALAHSSTLATHSVCFSPHISSVSHFLTERQNM